MSSTWILPDDLQPAQRGADFPAPGQPVPDHWSKCFGCGDDQPAGLAMSFTADEGPAVIGRLTVANKFQGGPGVIHGGILSTAFDESQGMACVNVAPVVVTAHLEIDFATPIPLGSVLEIRARVDGVVRRKIYTSAEARIVEGDFANPDVVVGTSRALFIAINFEQHFEKMKDHVDFEPATKQGGASSL